MEFSLWQNFAVRAHVFWAMNALRPSAIVNFFPECLAIEDLEGLLHPLTEFVDDPDGLERFESDGAAMPEPFRGLLVHNSDMTSTLEKFHRERPYLEVLAKRRRDTSLFRQVLLRGQRSHRAVEYGAIRIELEELGPEARWAVLEGSRPLGGILADFHVSYVSRPQSYFGVRAGSRLQQLLGLNEPVLLYGRKNFLQTPEGGVLAEVVEILPPLAPSGPGSA